MQKLIEAINKYVDLTEEDISVIDSLFIRREIAAGECFLKSGKICREFAFVERGVLRHFICDNGDEKTFYFSAEDDFVCDYESFIDRSVSQKTIIAIENTLIYSITYDGMQKFYETVNSGERFGRLFLEGIFSKAIRHIISMHTDTAEERYFNFLKLYSHIQQRIPQYYIASFVGITPQSLSRIRRRFIKK